MATTLFDTLLIILSRCVINHIRTSSLLKNNIRKTKTDKVDTFVIDKALITQEHLRFITYSDIELNHLEDAYRQRAFQPRQKEICCSYIGKF